MTKKTKKKGNSYLRNESRAFGAHTADEIPADGVRKG